MARIRTIKPEFPQSESVGRLSRDARLLFIELWTIADDAGRLRGNSRMLASLLFPYDDDAKDLIDDWLLELEVEGCILSYLIGNDKYIEICNWLNHQKIDKPSPSKIPPSSEGSPIAREDSRGLAVGPGPGPGPGPKDHGGEGTKNNMSISSTVVQEIFGYWCLVMGSPKSKLDGKRVSLIKKALGLGYTVEDVKAAIDGCKRTPYNMGDNPQGTKYNGLDLILRSAEKIDKFIAAPAVGEANGQTGQRGNGNSNGPSCPADRVAANIARERAERAAARPGNHPGGLVADDPPVRPQVDESVRGSDRPGERMGSVIEGSFERAS